MSENFTTTPKDLQGVDTRPFIELWYTMPEAAKQMLIGHFKKAGIYKQMWAKWLTGSVPRQPAMRKLQVALKNCFGLKTKPFTLFPGEDMTRYLIDKYAPKAEDVRVDWPSLREQENEE